MRTPWTTLRPADGSTIKPTSGNPLQPEQNGTNPAAAFGPLPLLTNSPRRLSNATAEFGFGFAAFGDPTPASPWNADGSPGNVTSCNPLTIVTTTTALVLEPD